MPLILNFFLFVLLTAGLCIVGCILMFVFKKKAKVNSFRDVFFALTIGTTLFVAGTAVYATGGKTVMSFYLPLLPLMIALYPQSEKKAEKNLDFWFGVCTVLVFSFFFSFSNYKDFSGDGKPLHLDYYFYANVAHHIFETGFENTYHALNILDKRYHGITFYHYYELWLNAGISKIVGTKQLDTFFVYTFPVLITILSLGLLSLAEHLGSNGKKRFLFLLLIFGLASPVLPLHEKIEFLDKYYSKVNINIFSLGNFLNGKHIPYYPFVILGLLGVAEKRNEFTGAAVFGLVLASFTTFPAGAGGFVFYLLVVSLLNYISEKKFPRRNWLILSVFIAANLLLLLFYKLYSVDLDTYFSLEKSANDWIFDVEMLFKRVKFFFGTALRILLLYGLYFALVIFALYRKCFALERDWVLFAISILLAGAGAAALLILELNSLQLFYNVAFVMMNCLFFAFFVQVFLNQKKDGKFTFAAGILLIALFLTNLINKIIIAPYGSSCAKSGMYKKIGELLKENTIGRIGGSLQVRSDDPYERGVTVYTKGIMLNSIADTIAVVSLDDLDILPNSDSLLRKQEFGYIAEGVFWQYANDLKKTGKFTTIGKAQVDFVKEKNIRFLLTDLNYPMHEELRNLVDTSFIFKNEKTVLHLLR